MIDKSPEAVALRRIKRAEKRVKQREENIVRAKAMHVERLKSARTASSTKAVSPARAKILKATAEPHIGCSGWYYWHWKGQFYPADLPGSQWFNHYMNSFDTVELNAPFYSWPSLATVKSWIRQAQAQPFVYTIKVCELITHIKRFRGTKTLIKDFYFIADLLGPRMGCFLFQLPPSFQYTRGRLQAIVTQLDATRRNVVEFRHASWWRPEVFSAFRKANIAFCSCSGPKLPDELVATSDDIYVRFHGKAKWYLHDYSDEELTEWVKRIRTSGAKRIWAYFNNDRNGHAIKNAKTFSALLRQRSLSSQ